MPRQMRRWRISCILTGVPCWDVPVLRRWKVELFDATNTSQNDGRFTSKMTVKGKRKMKEYQVTVYRTVQQSATVTIESDRELNTSEIEYIRNKAEDETSKLADYDWKDEEVDDKVDVTIYDGNTYYLT